MTGQSLPRRERGAPIRLLLLALAGVAAIGTAVVVGLREGAEPTEPVRPTAPHAAAPELARPSFDVVRINPQGDAVIAGHATPGGEISILDGGQEIGRADVGPDGTWVFVPAQPLPPGARELTLVERTPKGQRLSSLGSVLLVVPQRGPSGVPGALALLSTPGGAPRLLQSPAAGGLGVDAAELDEHGALRLAGRAPPDATVRVYLDGHKLGDARAAADGRWTLAPSERVAPGEHRLRLDQLGRDGQVLARAEVPLPRDTRATLAQGGSGAVTQLTIARGQTLWRLARSLYGRGASYTLLYEANRGQIENPGRIYPGQVFKAPASGGAEPRSAPLAH